MASITFEVPGSNGCQPSCNVICSGDHTLVKGVAPLDPTRGYTILVAYKKTTDTAYANESEGDLGDGTWSWPKSGTTVTLEEGRYDFRATLKNGMSTEDTKYKYNVHVCCTDVIIDSAKALQRIDESTHNAIFRNGWYNPAAGNYLVGVLYTKVGQDLTWVPVGYNRAELSCKPDRVDWRLTFCLPKKGRYKIHYLLIRNPGEVAVYTTEIFTAT
jgi:hypothetical protein